MYTRKDKSTILKILIAIIIICMFLYQFKTVNYNSPVERKITDSTNKINLIDNVNNNNQKSSKIENAKEIIDKPSLYLNDHFNNAYFKYRNHSSKHSDASVKYVNNQSNLRDDHLNKKFYLIVEYTPFIGRPKYCDKKLDYESYKELLGSDLFRNLNILVKSNELNDNNRLKLFDECSFKNCFFTCDKSHVNNADALVFHLGDYNHEVHNLNELNKNRKREQIWIIWNDEANRVSNRLDEFLFNWTISYKFESEASYGSYGVFSPTVKIEPNENEFKQKLLDSFNKRKKQAVWFVSNCDSRYRIDAANALGQHFALNVYGACGYQVNSRQNKNENECPYNSECQKKSLEESKFYLAFESKNCSDYITEKFWRTLAHGLIPVLIQPSKLFYERISPPNSFIHAEDFNYDYKQLADYMSSVSNNFELYYNYLKWTKFTNLQKQNDVVFDAEVEKLRLCELCMKMNKEKSEIYYKSVSKYFNDQCIIN